MRFLIFICLVMSFCLGFSQNRVLEASRQYEEALDFYRAKEFRQAREKINPSIQNHATANSYYLSGLLYEAEDQPLRALSDYEATVKLNPEYSEAYFSKGVIYLTFRNPEQAAKDFTYLIENGSNGTTRSIMFEIDPSGAQQNTLLTLENIQSRLYYYRAQAYEKMDLHGHALEDYETSLAIEPRPDTYVGRGLWYSQNGDIGLAALDFKRAIALDPQHQLAWYNLLVVEPSTKIPEELLIDHSFGPTLNLLAVESLEKGDPNQAVRYFNAALRANEDALTLLNRGRAFMKLKKYKEARLDFQRAKYLEPQRVEALYLLGNAYFKEKQFEQALAYYNQYLSIDPTHHLTWYNAAMAQFELDNDEEACHFLKTARDLGMVLSDKMINSKCLEY